MKLMRLPGQDVLWQILRLRSRPRMVLVFILSFLVRFRDSRLTETIGCPASVRLRNVEGQSGLGTRSLAIEFEGLVPDAFVRVATRTFMSLKEAEESHYALMASPTLFPGQTHPGRRQGGRRQSC